MSDKRSSDNKSTHPIVHVPFGYLPDTLGGTETYVAGLIRELASLSISSAVMAAGERANYIWESTRVVRLPPSPGLSREALYGEGDAEAAVQFGVALDSIKPQLVHFHAFTSGASLLAMKESAKRGIPLVMTYHTPTVTCVRGTMLHWGRTPCDGRMTVKRCASCTLQGHGLPQWLSVTVAQLPLSVSKFFARNGQSRAATVLGMLWLTSIRHQAVRSAFSLCHYVVSPCNWVSAVLRGNGVPATKIVLSRQGMSRSETALSPEVNASDRLTRGVTQPNTWAPLRLIFLGRIHPTKGLHTLLEAMALRPELAVSLSIYSAKNAGDAYYQKISALAERDARVSIRAALPNADVVSTMRDYDIAVVPSEWLETGPLVVYEAFAAGLPVLGSDLGGIAELVDDGRTGRLVPPGNVSVWASAIAEIADNRTLLTNWQQNLPPPRTMREVAEDMRTVYDNSLNSPLGAATP